ncbi:MAG: hypothetical protein JSV09_06985 [Thermoplasmata archaeon]|nr:MAG: hypothetical protein JSV09_06985 [Thermoplasmata archaeon]
MRNFLVDALKRFEARGGGIIMIKCSQCGGTKFEQGSLEGFSAIKIHSVEGSGSSTIPVAYVCLDCGHIEMFASPPE